MLLHTGAKPSHWLSPGNTYLGPKTSVQTRASYEKSGGCVVTKRPTASAYSVSAPQQKKKKFHRSKVRRASSASCNAGKFPVAFCMIMYAYKQEWLQNNIDCVSSFMGPCTCQNSYRYRMIVFEANWTRSLQVVAACSSLGGDFTLQVRIRSLSAAADNIASSLSQG